MTPFIEGLIAGYGIAIPVGAIAILIVEMGLRCGFKVGFMAGAGAAAADLLYATLATLSGTAIIVWLEPVITELRVVSALVLLGLGLRGLVVGLGHKRSSDRSAEVCGPGRMFFQFLGLTIINPLTIIYFTALIVGAAAGGNTSTGGHLLFIIGAGLASLSWQTLLAGLGASASHRLPLGFQSFAVVGGNLVIIALGARIILALVW